MDEETGFYNISAYLIAQLAKNYSVSKTMRIEGQILLTFAINTIKRIRKSIGGVLEFIECENNEFLLNFYQKNGFKFLEKRQAISQNDGCIYQLNQLIKLI